MSIHHISVAQFDVALARPQDNLERACALLERVGEARPHLVVLPEVFTTNFTFRGAPEIAAFSAKAITHLAELARRKQIAVAGSLIERAGGAPSGGGKEERYQNRFFFVDERGTRLSHYAKRHLIRLGHEHLFYEPGGTPEVFPWQGFIIGPAVCYDLRFPEFLGRLALAGADVLLLPAQWPAARAAHWKTLLRARAVENQCYVVGCNRTGALDGAPYGGGSAIIDPWGETLADAGEEPECLIGAAVSPERVREVRRQLPAFPERREEEGSHT